MPTTESDYVHTMLYTAARACIRHGMDRKLAALEFLAAFDVASVTPESRTPPPILKDAIGRVDGNKEINELAIVAAGLRKCGEEK